jgi:hypothetical protein
MASDELVVIVGPEWEKAALDLEKADAELPGKLRAGLREVAETKAEEARNKVRAFPTHGSKHTGLRERVAAGVEVSDTADGVQVDTNMDKADERNIPLGLDRPEGWSHPLFGNRNHWYRNEGGSWFRETFEAGENDFSDRLDRTLDETANEVG